MQVYSIGQRDIIKNKVFLGFRTDQEGFLSIHLKLLKRIMFNVDTLLCTSHSRKKIFCHLAPTMAGNFNSNLIIQSLS